MLELPCGGYCFDLKFDLAYDHLIAKGNNLLKQNMHIQNLSKPVFFIISASIVFKLLHFKWTIVRHNEHSIKFLQLTDLLYVLQITLADIRPEKSIKKDNKMW